MERRSGPRPSIIAVWAYRALAAILLILIIVFLSLALGREPDGDDIASAQQCSNANVDTALEAVNALTLAVASGTFDLTQFFSYFSPNATWVLYCSWGYNCGSWTGFGPDEDSIPALFFFYILNHFPLSVQLEGVPTWDCGFNYVDVAITVAQQIYCPEDFPGSLTDVPPNHRTFRMHFDNNGLIDYLVETSDESVTLSFDIFTCDFLPPFTAANVTSTAIGNSISLSAANYAYVPGQFAPHRSVRV